MTYRYYNVRREIYNHSSEKELNKYRTFKELKKLYKPFHWIIFSLMILSLVAFIIVAIAVDNKLWCSIPLLIIIVCDKLWDSKAERFYNKEEREKELKSIDSAYEEYLKTVKNILINNGIDTKVKCNCLKEECLSVFKKRELKYSILNNRVFEITIGIPIGALISTIISNDTDTITIQAAAFLLIGIVIYALISFSRFITYHTSGYWKDEQLLNALEEMDYYF
ncbi:MAG: hypothetical protein IJK26_07940 [Clostridia bacterium]|nr:hypothetical protein [Clostridia bacterium]